MRARPHGRGLALAHAAPDALRRRGKGRRLDKDELEAENRKAEARGARPSTTMPVLLGITKASLQTRSFISAASFQETTRVLTEASISG